MCMTEFINVMWQLDIGVEKQILTNAAFTQFSVELIVSRQKK